MFHFRRLVACVTLCAAAATVAPLYSQVPDAPTAEATPAGDGTVVTKANPEPQTQEATTVRERANEWLKTKGWKKGKNPNDKSFVDFSVAPYDLKSQRWALVRSNAFQAAFLDAKRKLAEHLSVDISTTVANSIRQGSPQTKDDGQPIDIIESVLQEAKEEGVDAGALGTNTRFGRAVRVLARAEVAGSQVVKVFDDRDQAGNGAIAVVVRWTPKSEEIVEAVLGRKVDKVTSAVAAPVADLPNMSPSDLDSLFGARIMRESDGEACIVAFGQGDVLGRTEAAVGAAEKVASADALGNLRQFVGELVVCEQLLDRRGSIDDLIDAETKFKTDQSFREVCTAEAQSLQFQGVEEVHTWEGKTDGKHATVGVVKKWTVSGANDANVLRRKFEALAASAGGKGRRDIGVPAPSTAGKDSGRSGGKPVPQIKTRSESPDLPGE
jgi:hypothetical protein